MSEGSTGTEGWMEEGAEPVIQHSHMCKLKCNEIIPQKGNNVASSPHRKKKNGLTEEGGWVSTEESGQNEPSAKSSKKKECSAKG